ncbi:unnamed protein product [Rhizophagus irregularis]|uniref:Uncharacterized protein n=1 Tax=Rhizophagus irregularis TaxID=588596 RepID=A0A2I1FYW4_9GLOM|nr:hypothetical protein RhiirA4_415110 [Rhizophagus irregularis]CAB4404447.1 unnamed protein product [Rhizophagus irregularis]
MEEVKESFQKSYFTCSHILKENFRSTSNLGLYCTSESVAKLTDARWSVDSNNAPVLTVTYQGKDPIQAIDKFMTSPPYDYSLDAYYIYVIDPIFMNGYSSDMFNGTNSSTYVGSNPHTMQIPYDPRNLPSSGTMIMVTSTVYHGCHRDNDDSELMCSYCQWGTFRPIP